MSPRLSVVIPVKDCLPYLPKAIDSIRRQGIDDIETVVIDDQSTDGLDRWLAEEIKRDPHLKSRPGPGEGVAAARNAGLALCSAPLIAFLDADDSWNENAIADRLSLMEENPEVERHRGTLSFETEVGRGTVFHVDLPAADPLVGSPADETAGEILVVEDDRDTAELLCAMLVRSGFSVSVAATAGDAEVRAINPATRVVLVDLGLPDRDGIGLIRSLRADERTRRIPIIVVTARKRDEAGAAEADALEVLDWIEKPVDPVRLREALQMAVGPSGSAQILHVEDDPDVRQLVAHALAHAGAIHPVATLAEAKAAVAARRFDVVILDMTLPDGAGTELLPLLKTEVGDLIPVIVFSARTTDPETARQVQVTLTKSQNSLEHLVRIVSRLCRSARSYQNQPAGSSP